MRFIELNICLNRQMMHHKIPKTNLPQIKVFLSSIEDCLQKEKTTLIAHDYPEINDPIKGVATSLMVFRRRYKLSQTEMAKKIGISHSDLSKMERAKMPIGKKIAMRIGKALNLDYKIFL